jgi:hypothetical protein
VKTTSFWARRGRGFRNGAGAIGHGRLRNTAAEARRREDLAEQLRQLAPLRVLAATTDLGGEGFEPGERGDLDLELGDRRRRRGLVEHLLLGGFDLVLGRLVEVLEVFGIERRSRDGGHRHGRAALQELQLAQALLQAFAPAAQGLVDRLRRGGQTPLQDGEREADGSRAFVVLERLGAVELLAHVLGHFLVEARLGVRELVGHRVGDALREERPAVELEQALLDHAAHEVGGLDLVDAVAEPALEAVAVEQGEEELEVFFLAVVRRGRHQQEVARKAREELAEPVALGVLHLAAEERGRELVGLVADDEVVAAVGGAELLLHVLVARELVEARDREVVLEEPVAGTGGFELVVGEDLEGQVEAPRELILPLFGQAAGADDQAALEIAARDQLLDEQTRHDRLAGAGVVGEEEAQRLARQHRLVDRGDLVRQRVHERGMNREHGVEEVRQADAVGFRDEAEEGAVAVEAPGSARFDHCEARLVVAVEDLVGDAAIGAAVDECEGIRAVPGHTDHRDQRIRQDPAEGRVGLKVFESSISVSLVPQHRSLRSTILLGRLREGG